MSDAKIIVARSGYFADGKGPTDAYQMMKEQPDGTFALVNDAVNHPTTLDTARERAKAYPKTWCPQCKRVVDNMHSGYYYCDDCYKGRTP